MTTTGWSELTHAYGSAEDIPLLFARLGGSEDDAVWAELWGALCHQGSVYDASWAAIPLLTDIARGRTPGDPVQAVAMAGAVMSDPDPACRERYAREIGELLVAARELLTLPDQEPSVFVHLQMAVLAFEGDSVWAEALEGVNSEEYELECPGCEAGLFVAFGSYGTFVSSGDYVTAAGAEPTEGRAELSPADPARLEGIGARLHQEAVRAGQPAVARALTQVFGTGRCPSCEREFAVGDEVERQWV
ncbi:hypothetical protein ABZT03_22615 [Streptomyces sp. NPDC005574]|uniref:hypothetical protein n=1 Tax=Streptomyces sp. NPDC005574 TaxID=3156891 RepID=UPI0033AE6C51